MDSIRSLKEASQNYDLLYIFSSPSDEHLKIIKICTNLMLQAKLSDNNLGFLQSSKPSLGSVYRITKCLWKPLHSLGKSP